MPMQKCNHAIRAISVFLAICLIFSCFHVLATPADASAAAVASGLVIIGGVVGVGIILQAMGVRPSGGSGSASWQSLCSNAYAYLQTLSLATVRGISLATSGGRAYVKRDVISALRDWLFSSNTIYSPHLCTSTFSIDGQDYIVTGNAPVYLHHVYKEWSPYDPSNPSYVVLSFAVSTESFTYRNGSSTKKVYAFGVSGIYYHGLVQWKSSAPVGRYVSNFPYSDSALKSYISADSFSLTDDVLADDLYFDVVKPDVDTDIEIVYVDWAGLEKQLEFPDPDNNDDDDQEDQEDPDKDPEKPPTKPAPGWPIYIPPKPENPDNIPQRELQDPDPDPNLDPDEVQDPTKDPDPTETPDSTEDSDPNKDPTGPTYNPGGNDPFDPGTGTEGGKDDVVIKPPSAKPQNYGVDLTRYFPFCIPFDIYKMLSLLSAEPETPHFTVTLFGKQTTIELSMFDGVAAVARTMETLLFAVTLAAGTKKLIGW